MSAEIPDAEAVVGQFWPLHGPYSPQRTAGAAATAAELVRYLNHATEPGGAGVPAAATAYRTVGGLQAVASGLAQTLSQLDRHVQLWSEHAALYDDTAGGDDQAAAAARAEAVSAAVDDAVLVTRSLAHALARVLARVHRELGHPQD